MKNTVSIEIVDAKYIENYVLNIFFSDDTNQKIDFQTHFMSLKGYYTQYQEMENFKKFKIENGNLVWGEDWDVIFPNYQLHKGKIKE
jgi:hypothetical protein